VVKEIGTSKRSQILYTESTGKIPCGRKQKDPTHSKLKGSLWKIIMAYPVHTELPRQLFPGYSFLCVQVSSHSEVEAALNTSDRMFCVGSETATKAKGLKA
jgi:hypothetical protein